MQLAHVSQNQEIDSLHRANHFNYAHFVVFVLELSSIILLTFVRVRSSHSFSFPCIFAHLIHFLIFRFLHPFNSLLHLIKVCMNIKLWQLIHGKWLSLLIKCIPCFSDGKFHGNGIGTRCQQIKFNADFSTINHWNVYDNKHNAHAFHEIPKFYDFEIAPLAQYAHQKCWRGKSEFEKLRSFA